ncbi:MAG: PAS domain-containing sensor histidine kinase [Neptuniibacter caesariensis]|uniref:histidine kinase n=1 Tax=Neptuniibacter caesariensis TaxID=207954 RepID=A0A2G6JMB7_NEPCE|nr:MAG: PAS domain-containing sensor histidine kinase [Neptuniibacter caesariensis]
MDNEQQYLNRIAQLESELAFQKQQLAKASVGAGPGTTESTFGDRYRHLLAVLPAGVVLIDGKGEVAEANPAAINLLGEPLVGEPWHTIIGRSFAPQRDDGHEVSLKDGRKVSLLTQAMANEPGQLLLLTDQTETRLLQGRLSHYQRLSEMGRMMASLAHQIRTPLAAALLYVDHLTRPDLQPEQRRKFATKAKSRLSNLEQQIRDMLIFARGEMRLDDLVSVKDLVAEFEDRLDLPLVNHDADCDCQNEAPDLLLQCNKEALLGVCMNLVENALQACGKGAELLARFYAYEGKLRIDIVDHGPGMSDDSLNRVLEPFYTTKTHGTGLGLAVAQVVAHAHHGAFTLTSEQGEGTVASLILPVSEPEQP